MKNPQYITKQDPVSGQTYRVASYLTTEDVHKLLLDLKQKKEEAAKMAEVQKLAGTVGSET